MQKTRIEWADMVFNPVTGCHHGCPYCYARSIANRFGGHDDRVIGKTMLDSSGKYVLHETRSPMPLTDKNGVTRPAPFPYHFESTMRWERLDEPQHVRKPQTVFVCSMADLFGEWVPDEWIQAVFDACKATPQHRYLFLTKNPKRYGELYAAGNLPKEENFWYGTTITTAHDLRFPGALRLNTFLSVEPLLEPLNVGLGSFGFDSWVIIGAETGNRKGKVTPEKAWIKKIGEAAAITHIPVFMKDSLLPIMGEDSMQREFPWRTDV